MSFLGFLNDDLNSNFFEISEFGEEAILLRNGSSFKLRVLYDKQALEGGESVGGDIPAISHSPRLFVRSADLPDGKAKKGDEFSLSANEIHPAGKLRAVDFADEKNGCVVYRLLEE
jgi:hypothetical protein